MNGTAKNTNRDVPRGRRKWLYANMRPGRVGERETDKEFMAHSANGYRGRDTRGEMGRKMDLLPARGLKKSVARIGDLNLE
jgi:hypothetical protein